MSYPHAETLLEGADHRRFDDFLILTALRIDDERLRRLGGNYVRCRKCRDTGRPSAQKSAA